MSSLTWIVLRHEWRLLRADRTLAAVTLLLALLVGYSLANGEAWVRFQQRTLAAAAEEEAERLSKLQKHLADIEAGRAEPKGFQDPRSAGAIGGNTAAPYLSMPPAALAALAVGQSDLYPYYFKLNLRSKQAILANDEIENPTNLLAGRFDLAFVLIYLFPLLILALGYNLISAEREQGTLVLCLSQPISLRHLVRGKILLRATGLLGLLVGLTLGGALLVGVDLSAEGVLLRLGLWILMMALYASFWFALAVWVNTFSASSATNALLLAGCWLAFVLVLPSVANLLATSLYPVPSRVEMVQAMRNAGKEAQAQGSQLLSRYMEDHPELAPADSKAGAADFASITYAVQMEVDRKVQPILDQFDQQVARQQAFVDRFRFISPAILVQGGLNDVAGTSLGRYQHFTGLVSQFFDRWQAYFLPKVFSKVLLRSDQVQEFPRYRWVEEPVSAVASRLLTVLAALLLLNLLVILPAWSRLRRFSLTS